MPTILDIVRKQKSLNDILKQAGRVRNKADDMGFFFNSIMEGRKKRNGGAWVDGSRLKQARNEHWDVSDKVARDLILDVKHPEAERFEKSRLDHLDYCADKFPFIRDAYEPLNKGRRDACESSWWTDVLPGLLPSESQIRLDPLNYTDHFSKYIRDYARKLVNGEIE